MVTTITNDTNVHMVCYATQQGPRSAFEVNKTEIL